MNEYLTWEYLSSFAGIVAAVTLIIQFTKMPLDRIWKIPTRFVVLIISVALLFAVEWVTKGFVEPEKIILLLLNGIVVSMASMGAYEVTFKKYVESIQQKKYGKLR